jgi:membrane protease YdiL (CAAX protease family)
MHFQYHHFELHKVSIIQVLYSFGAGMGLGVIRQQTNNLLAPMLVHSAFNSFFNLTLAVLTRVGRM